MTTSDPDAALVAEINSAEFERRGIAAG